MDVSRRLEQVVYRLTPADQADTIQIPSGSESNDKNLIELKIGDKIDMEGFLYWYEGANPHITSVVVK